MATSTIAALTPYWPATSADLAQWVSAIGSLLVIIVALFGDGIRKTFLNQIFL